MPYIFGKNLHIPLWSEGVCVCWNFSDFIFQFQRFNVLLLLTDAKSICVPEKMTLPQRYFIDLFSSNSDPCLVYESVPVNSRHELAYSTLKENFSRRPILEKEISLAIIESSCEVYCNATRTCPILSDSSSLNISSDYNSWNVEAPNPTIVNRRASLFKRPRCVSVVINKSLVINRHGSKSFGRSHIFNWLLFL